MKENAFLLVSLFLFLESTTICAQQQLNMDFEQPSVEGNLRPYNWQLDHYSEVESRLDSIQKKSGDFSFCFRGKSEEMMQSLSIQIEPYELIGKTITISGWIKTDSDSGKFGMAYGHGVELSDYSFDMLGDTLFAEKTSKDWQYLEARFKIPDTADIAFISLLHFGKGNSWFDDFELRLNDQRIESVEVAPPFSEDQEAWIEDQSFILDSVDASPINDPEWYKDDLTAFIEMNQDSRIIALGESTHGTSEFFRLKHRLLTIAVQELGVRIFAIEDNQLIVEGVNRYVKGGEGTARSSMYGMFSISQNQEVHDLIQWVRDYNDHHPNDQLSFVGFDMQYLPVMVDSMSSFTQRQLLDQKPRVDSLLAPMIEHFRTSFDRPEEEKREWLHATKQVLAIIERASEKRVGDTSNCADSLDWSWGKQYANLMIQYATNISRGYSSLYRDQAMADNVSWILDQHGEGSKMVIWAHDYHVSLGEDDQNENNIYAGVSMGHHLRKKYGTDYKAYGLWTYQGTYRAQRSYSNFQQFDCPLCLSPRGSLDEVFHRIAAKKKSKGLFLDLSHGHQQAWLCQTTPMRFANHVAFEYAYYTRYSIPYQFDGIFFWDQTSAAKSYSSH